MKKLLKIGDKIKRRHTGRIGKIVKIEPGCNTIYWVMFDGNEFLSPMPKQDIEGLKR